MSPVEMVIDWSFKHPWLLAKLGGLLLVCRVGRIKEDDDRTEKTLFRNRSDRFESIRRLERFVENERLR